MARKPRIHFPGAVYHVMLQGNARAEIFFKKEDRHRFYLLLLQEGVERFGCRIHAFCLMTNHVHLAVQVGATPLSRLMQNLNFRYTQWINHRYRRMGRLFQGRYKAILVDRDNYLLELVRYIHLSPVQARLVRAPAAYRWSGHRAATCYDPLPEPKLDPLKPLWWHFLRRRGASTTLIFHNFRVTQFTARRLSPALDYWNCLYVRSSSYQSP